MSVPVPGRPATQTARRSASRIAFYGHLWFGVIFSAALIVISVTGILLNHKRALGLMPHVPHAPTAPFSASLQIDRLAYIALQAADPTGKDSLGFRSIDRMDVRPRDGFVKVRLRNPSSTEVTVDVVSGRVLHIGARGDAYLEKLHSGEIFGGQGVLLSDAAAVALLVTIITGYWLWLVPKLRRAREDGSE